MIITVHVDPCPTCQGEGYASNEMVMGVECPDCPIVPGYQVPDPWFVVVPTRWWTDSAPGDGASSLITDRPDPRWQPGATIALSTDSGDPTEPPEKVGSAVIAELLQCFDAGDPDYYEQADHISLSDDPADVPAEIWRYVGVGKGEAGPFNIEPVSHLPACKPDDTLARLETP